MATLGGGIDTLGVGTTLGWRSAKLGRGCMNRKSRSERAGATCFSGVVGGTGAVAVGGTGDIVGGVIAELGIQFVKMLQSFEMAVSCSWWMVVGAYLIAQERKFRVWTMRSPSLTVGWVR